MVIVQLNVAGATVKTFFYVHTSQCWISPVYYAQGGRVLNILFLCLQKVTLCPLSPPLSSNRSSSNLLFICYCHVFFKLVKFCPNVSVLVILVVKFGRRNVVDCRNKFRVNISVSNTTHSKTVAIRLGMARFIVHTIQLEGSGDILPQKILEAMRLLLWGNVLLLGG